MHTYIVMLMKQLIVMCTYTHMYMFDVSISCCVVVRCIVLYYVMLHYSI